MYVFQFEAIFDMILFVYFVSAPDLFVCPAQPAEHEVSGEDYEVFLTRICFFISNSTEIFYQILLLKRRKDCLNGRSDISLHRVRTTKPMVP